MDFTIKTEQKQKQTLSYQRIQISNLLQMNSIQLEQYLNEQAVENPVLELVFGSPAYETPKLSTTQQTEDPGHNFPEWNFDLASSETLSDHLWNQLLTLPWPSEQEEALHFLLDSLDEKGYFTDSLEEFALRFHLQPPQAENLLFLIQSLEPAGIGARSLEECLCLQLNRTGQLTTELKQFLHENLSLIGKNQLAAIARKEKMPLTKVKKLYELIRSLNPKPGSLFAGSARLDYIIPDIMIEKDRDHISLTLNESVYPQIEINSYYSHLFENSTDHEVKNYLQKKIQQTQWLQQCINQRNSTLLSVTKAIVTMQQEFFFLGPDHLKPLKQADIADYLNIHVSTVSRACKGKYLQCNWGIFPLTFFFARAAVKKNQDFACIPNTSRNIQNALARLIESENKLKPYSDRTLAELLTSQGFSISRRTVTKYREKLEIPCTTKRKKY